MSGLVKAKKYDWKDSNLALFGSDLEKNVKRESAAGEPAWKGSGAAPGLRIWRIVKFKVTDWPKEDYGKFYNGDSYIVLNTYKEEDGDQLLHDVHFWIGQYSTQDEYGTAAYKTVELDTFHNDVPVQHREVMGHESDLFKSYFQQIELLNGGADTGFRHVKPEEYKPRLLHFSGTSKKIVIKEVPLLKSRLNSGDVYILDLGLEIYQWNGKECNKDEKFKAVQYLQTLKSDRSGKPKVETLDERSISPDHPFYQALEANETDSGIDDDDEDQTDAPADKKLFRLSDASGKLEMSEVEPTTNLDSHDVFIIDVGNGVTVWIGIAASANEKKKGMQYAHNYLMKTDHPLVPVTSLVEGQKTQTSKAF